MIPGSVLASLGNTPTLFGMYHAESSSNWFGFRVWNKRECAWRYFTILRFAQTITESKFKESFSCTSSEKGNWKYDHYVNYHLESKNDLLHEQLQLKTTTVSVCSTQLNIDLLREAAIKNGKLAVIIDDYVVFLAGRKPFALRLSDDNSIFMPEYLQFNKVEVDALGSIIDAPKMIYYSNSVLMSLSTDLAVTFLTKMQDTYAQALSSDQNFSLLPILNLQQDVDAKNVVDLFWSTMSDKQRQTITNFKLFIVSNPLLMVRFFTAYKLLDKELKSKIDRVSPQVVFHGIKINSKQVAQQICEFGFKSDASGRFLYGGIGPYFAQKSAIALDGYMEQDLGRSENYGNYVLACLVLPGCTKGNGKQNQQMKRDQHSWNMEIDGSKIYCIRDELAFPLYVFQTK